MSFLLNPYAFGVAAVDGSFHFDGSNDYMELASAPVTAIPCTIVAWMRAANDLYVARAFRAGKAAYDGELYKQSVRDAVGGLQKIQTGGMLTFGGTESVVPGAGSTNWQSRIDNLSGADIHAMGGTNLGMAPEAVAMLIRQTGGFSYGKDGLEVTVELSGGTVRLATPDGLRPFVLRP